MPVDIALQQRMRIFEAQIVAPVYGYIEYYYYAYRFTAQASNLSYFEACIAREQPVELPYWRDPVHEGICAWPQGGYEHGLAWAIIVAIELLK